MASSRLPPTPPEPPPERSPLSDWRGAVRLATDATTGLTDLVEAVHGRVLRPPGLRTPAPADRAGGLTGVVYRSVRAVQRGVGRGLEGVLAALDVPGVLPRGGRPSARRDAIVSALNGVIGDRLEASGNPLAIRAALKRRGQPLVLDGQGPRDALRDAMPDAGPDVLVLVHGLCMGDAQWRRQGLEHGAALEAALGFTAVHAHLNTGRAVHENGRDLARMVEALLNAWPVTPRRLVLLGYSQGGLVARSALHQAREQGLSWPARLSDLVFLGTPHLGAPLERIGAWIDSGLGLAPYAAPLARLTRVRSAGITDLRQGCWWSTGTEPGPGPGPGPSLWPAGLRCHALAASTAAGPHAQAAPRRRAWPGDGLVPLSSALGQHRDPARALPISDDQRWIGWGLNHLDLLSAPAVQARLQEVLAAPPEAAGPAVLRPRPRAVRAR